MYGPVIKSLLPILNQFFYARNAFITKQSLLLTTAGIIELKQLIRIQTTVFVTVFTLF